MNGLSIVTAIAALVIAANAWWLNYEVARRVDEHAVIIAAHILPLPKEDQR